MKLADATIYNDGDLSISFTENSIICANMLGSRIRSFYVANSTCYQTPCEYCEIWRSNDREIPLALDNLQDIVIIYRAPLEGVGPEMIEELHDKHLEETHNKVEEFLTKTSKRIIEKVVDVTRAVLEVE